MALQFPDPKFYRLFELNEAPGTVYPVGAGLAVTAMAQGSFGGELLSGVLQPGGGRWEQTTPDGTKLDNKYILQTSDGAVIMMNADGWKDEAGDHVHVHFETGSKKYAWLNQTIAVGRTELSRGFRVLAVYAMLPACAPAPKAEPAPLDTELLYYVEVNVGAQLKSGKYQGGQLLVIPITGGSFRGEALNGTVECLGADYNILNQGMPVTSRIATRYMLKTDDGAYISLVTDGRLMMDMKGVQAMMKDAPDYVEKAYFRQHLMFTTGTEKYRSLNKDICFAVIAMGKDNVVRYNAYRLK